MWREGIPDLREDELQITRIAATEVRNEVEEVVEVVLGTGAKRRRLERNTRHDINKSTGDVEELLYLAIGQYIRLSRIQERKQHTRPTP